jgi:hypothetical protein
MLFILISLLLKHTCAERYYIQYNPKTMLLENVEQPLVKLEKRAGTLSFKSKSFIFDLDCILPFGESTSGEDTCVKVQKGLLRGAERLENVIHLRVPIRVKINYRSFCEDKGTANGTACSVRNPALGFAAPSYWQQFTAQEANSLGLDENYLYPSALARQYRNLTERDSSESDISASFNSDYNFWFPTYKDRYGDPSSQIWGDTQNIKGGFYKQTDSYSYDFEQIVLHEIIHGLGMLSSWGKWIDPLHIIPLSLIHI